MPRLTTDYLATGKASIEFKDYAFIGKESTDAAEAAACALDQGQYWKYHETLYLNQNGENKGSFSASRLKEMAQQMGLDMTKFNQCFDGNQHADEIAAMAREANSQSIPGTPAFQINGQLIRYTGYGSLQAAIEAALNQK